MEKRERKVGEKGLVVGFLLELVVGCGTVLLRVQQEEWGGLCGGTLRTILVEGWGGVIQLIETLN